MGTPGKPDSNLRCIFSISKLFTDILESISAQKNPCLSGPQLAVQHIVFENNGKFLLLEVIKSRLIVENMFHDEEYSIWTDRQASRDLEETLTKYRNTSLRVLCTMTQLLDSLQQEVVTVNVQGMEESSRVPSIHPIPEQCLKLLAKLRICNDIFCALVRQVISERSGRAPRASAFSSGEGYRTYNGVQAAVTSNSHLFCIQRASQRLHEALTAVPSSYEISRHTIGISLVPESLKGLSEVRTTAIRFNLALTTALSTDATWLVVEAGKANFCSCHTEEQATPPESFSDCHRSERPANPASNERLKPSSSRHAFRGKSRAKSADCQNLEFITPLIQNLVAARFESFCDCQARNSSTLDDVLAQARAQHLSIPVEERLRVASHLASGVLCFISTPWLSSAWSSKNIHVFKNGLFLDGLPALGSPFFCTYAAPSMAKSSITTTRPTVSSAPFSDLGIVLLELAFSAPLRDLELSEDTISSSDSHIHSLTVTRLSQTVSRQLGSRYARVVQKCFSQVPTHQDLLSLEQPVKDYFFNDVVKELGQCLNNVTGELNRKANIVFLTLKADKFKGTRTSILQQTKLSVLASI